MKKLAIIGASYLQEPLIQKAKSMGIETHVFAWAVGDVGEKSADYFYPISIVEKEEILVQCRQIGIDGVCSISSDLAAITVNYIAQELGLPGNSPACVRCSTNKHEMRRCFEKNGDPSTKSIQVTKVDELSDVSLHYPVIVKPVDRSGSRGITMLRSPDGLSTAIETAKSYGFQKCALVEEFAEGREYSVECVSWQGKHRFLALTQKYTTGAPSFIETAHLEPAQVDEETLMRVQKVTLHALDSLGIAYGASHTELKIAENGEIKLIEIGGRMGGDCIGSSLVELSTGYDFLKAVIEIALGNEPSGEITRHAAAAVRFVFTQEDLDCLERLRKFAPELLVESNVREITHEKVTDSSMRFGFFVFSAPLADTLLPYLPEIP